MGHPGSQAVYDWLVEGAPGARTPADVMARVCPELLAAGHPLARAQAFVRTLHPHIAGRSFTWEPGGSEVAVGELSWAFLNSEAYRAGPVGRVCESGRVERLPGHEGFTELLVAPLRFVSGDRHGFTLATRAPGGFTDAQAAELLRVLVPLARVAEIFALYRTAANLLNTYVGHGAGERILAGRIQRGDTDRIQAVIWFSDLRGFTELSGRLSPAELIRVLNELFECQVPAIERHGGEVLKFMGDGLLAIFPFGPRAQEEPGGARARCAAALEASAAVERAVAALNDQRRRLGADPIRLGQALHVGEVTYGNIGGAGRLDFTCIGPAVNLAARLEGLAGKLTRPLVVSREFVELSGRAATPLGMFELKGVSGLVPAFELTSRQ